MNEWWSTPTDIAQVGADLRAVRKLIARLDHWTTGAFARDIMGKPVSATNPGARSFCLIGACQSVARDSNSFREYNRRYNQMTTVLANELAGMHVILGLADYNDYGTLDVGHNNVLLLIDRALKSADDKLAYVGGGSKNEPAS